MKKFQTAIAGYNNEVDSIAAELVEQGSSPLEAMIQARDHVQNRRKAVNGQFKEEGIRKSLEQFVKDLNQI